MQLSVLRPPKLSKHQFFLQWFVEACCESGISALDSVMLPWKMRQMVAKFRLSRHLACFAKLHSAPLIVPCAGYPDSFAFPFAYTREIVPVLWDTWPRYHDRIVSSFKRHKIRLAFFTQSRVAEKIVGLLPDVKCVWLPEGIKPDCYLMGDKLESREIDVLEMGRVLHRYHDAISARGCGRLLSSLDYPGKLMFKSAQELAKGIANAKIAICFPRCDTHPEMAGDIETLTQRYWECMLSRTIMVGHAPAELTQLIRYNPVIEVEWDNPGEQLNSILKNIMRYQGFVDKNYEVAMCYAPWKSRIPDLRSHIGLVYGNL